ncbi:D-alanyl-D-alanine carboxypeptidase/D-alanyl-D-alanine-endopeptidase [Niveibacterium sp. SC-1]|uniref:D-alanyl-D-alanine carboxypeptidase/D-alanyl-D-alanine endopeptidase n=1 Tax=Niveibacterium sp. SC-1 TaxID=3135646 RepID=UPI00311F1BC1
MRDNRPMRIPTLLIALFAGLATQAHAQLPAAVQEALRKAKLPEAAVSLWVAPAESGKARWTHNADQARNPASVMKLLTSFAALDLLGPAYSWETTALLDGTLSDGTLKGNLILHGSGDPFLTWDRLGVFLRELRSRGLRRIDGDLVLDRSAYALEPADPAQFDGRSARAYNAAPDALMVNFNAITLRLAIDSAGAVVAQSTQPFASLVIRNKLKPATGECGDWRNRAAAELGVTGETVQVVLSGSYAASCGEKLLNLAVPDARAQTGGVFRALWAELGGEFNGRVREGNAPVDARRFASWQSPPLADILRDTDKYSNNVMARQIFLALGQAGSTSPAPQQDALGAIARLQGWMPGQGLDPQQWVLENGSGLSRKERTTAAQLGSLLLSAWRSPRMPEFAAALPVIGVDGTMKRRLNASLVQGRGFVKTGTLDGVKSAAGYVLDAQGKWVAFAWLVNDAGAERSDPALDALIETLYSEEIAH